jgi:hypothetical protein
MVSWYCVVWCALNGVMTLCSVVCTEWCHDTVVWCEQNGVMTLCRVVCTKSFQDTGYIVVHSMVSGDQTCALPISPFSVHHTTQCHDTIHCTPHYTVSWHHSVYTTLHSIMTLFSVHHTTQYHDTIQCTPHYTVSWHHSVHTTLHSIMTPTQQSDSILLQAHFCFNIYYINTW